MTREAGEQPSSPNPYRQPQPLIFLQTLPCVILSLRRMVGAGDWHIISRGLEKPVIRLLRVEASLASVQYETCPVPTVLVIDHITGVHS